MADSFFGLDVMSLSNGDHCEKLVFQATIFVVLLASCDIKVSDMNTLVDSL